MPPFCLPGSEPVGRSLMLMIFSSRSWAGQAISCSRRRRATLWHSVWTDRDAPVNGVAWRGSSQADSFDGGAHVIALVAHSQSVESAHRRSREFLHDVAGLPLAH